MAKSKQTSRPDHLSQEKVYDSSGSENNQESDIESSPSSKPKKLPLRESRQSKSSAKLSSKRGKAVSTSPDTTSEDDEDSSDSEEDDNEDEETGRQESSSESSKRKSAAKMAEEPARKKSKSRPTTTSTVQIAPKPFKAPHGYEPVILSASDFASDSASLFENLQGKQIWHISAPDSVSIETIKKLDIQAALQGQPILTRDGVDYNMYPTLASNDVLLLPGGKDSIYEQSEMTIARSFHLRQMTSKPTQKTKDDEETPLIFTATAEGKAPTPRKKLETFKMRYTPFGVPPAPLVADDEDDGDVEMSTESATFKVPDEIVGERSSGKQSTNEEAESPMQHGEKRGKKSRDKDRGTGSHEKKRKKDRRIVDE